MATFQAPTSETADTDSKLSDNHQPLLISKNSLPKLPDVKIEVKTPEANQMPDLSTKKPANPMASYYAIIAMLVILIIGAILFLIYTS